MWARYDLVIKIIIPCGDISVFMVGDNHSLRPHARGALGLIYSKFNNFSQSGACNFGDPLGFGPCIFHGLGARFFIMRVIVRKIISKEINFIDARSGKSIDDIPRFIGRFDTGGETQRGFDMGDRTDLRSKAFLGLFRLNLNVDPSF